MAYMTKKHPSSQFKVIGILPVLLPRMPGDVKIYHQTGVVLPRPHVFLLPHILESSRFPFFQLLVGTGSDTFRSLWHPVALWESVSVNSRDSWGHQRLCFTYIQPHPPLSPREPNTRNGEGSHIAIPEAERRPYATSSNIEALRLRRVGLWPLPSHLIWFSQPHKGTLLSAFKKIF